MAIFCANCEFLIQPTDGGRFPPWCPQCGGDLKSAAERRAAASKLAVVATETKSAAEIAAGFHRRGPAPAPERSEAIATAEPVAEPTRTEEPTPVPSKSPHPEAPPTKSPSRVYYHGECGGRTSVSGDDYAALDDPCTWVSQTYCCRCGRFVPLESVVWVDTGECVAVERQRRAAAIPFWRRLLRLLFS
jgi:hypothetical protein